MKNWILITAGCALLIAQGACKADIVTLRCKGTMFNALSGSERAYSATFHLTKVDGKVIKVVDGEKTTFLPKKTLSKDGSYFTQLLVGSDRLTLRYSYPNDDAIYDTVIENSGGFTARLTIAVVEGDCSTGKSLY